MAGNKPRSAAALWFARELSTNQWSPEVSSTHPLRTGHAMSFAVLLRLSSYFFFFFFLSLTNRSSFSHGSPLPAYVGSSCFWMCTGRLHRVRVASSTWTPCELWDKPWGNHDHRHDHLSFRNIFLCLVHSFQVCSWRCLR